MRLGRATFALMVGCAVAVGFRIGSSMALRYSCFLSFRGGKGDLAKGVVELFANVLETELEVQVDAGLYRYSAKMAAGDIVDPTVAKALRDSACMIVLFTGTYFSKAHLYCAREYLAMTRLEEARLKQMSPDGPTHGLIVPVILRNLERLPPDLRKRYWFDFTEFEQDEDGISKPKRFFSDVRKIGDYVAARYQELDAVIGDREEEIQLPDDDETSNYVKAIDASLKTKVAKKAGTR